MSRELLVLEFQVTLSELSSDIDAKRLGERLAARLEEVPVLRMYHAKVNFRLLKEEVR